MYYLKYRPQTIEEIDTGEIRERLDKILSSKELSHAWLFTGPKGTGKTSAARIVAKAINCEKNSFAGQGKSIEPCNECTNCRAVTSGVAVDIIEMDAASNRKIDDIRTLIEQVKFAPLYARYKVYIIDEVHMLTTESFNALLKTLEEPPASTIFILATTEVDKLPKTILSRCLRLNFAKASSSDVMRQLKRIADKENLKIDDVVLKFIADNCDYSFRDAAKLLEEVVVQQIATVDGVRQLIGLAGDNIKLLTLIEKKDLKAALVFIEDYDKNGGNFVVLIEVLLDKLHDVLLAKAGALEKTPEYDLTLPQISSLIKLLHEAYNTLKFSPVESLPLTIAVVEYLSSNK